MIDLLENLRKLDHFRPLPVEKCVSKIMESVNEQDDEDDIFKAATPEDLQVRKDTAYQRKKDALHKYADTWKVMALTVNNPLHGVDVDDYNTGMYDWWKNNRWDKKGIKKIDADRKYIAFEFPEPIPHNKAVKLVRDFIKDWAYKPASQSKQMAVDDAVILDRTGTRYWERTDNGRIKKIDGNSVLVRFHHYGNVTLDASKFIYDIESNSWGVFSDADFKKAMTAKKGLPEVGNSIFIKIPLEYRVTHPSQYGRDNYLTHGKIESVENGKVTVSVPDYTSGWGDTARRIPGFTTEIPLEDIYYNWKNKDWNQTGVRE